MPSFELFQNCKIKIGKFKLQGPKWNADKSIRPKINFSLGINQKKSITKKRIDHLEEPQQKFFKKRKRLGGVELYMLGNGQSFWLKNFEVRLILDVVLV
jgi:hypothetical protein